MKGRLTGLNGFVGLLFLVVFLTLFAYNKKYIEIVIKIGTNDEKNYDKTINYVLKYW